MGDASETSKHPVVLSAADESLSFRTHLRGSGKNDDRSRGALVAVSPAGCGAAGAAKPPFRHREHGSVKLSPRLRDNARP